MLEDAKNRMLDAQSQFETIKKDNEKLAEFRNAMEEIFARMEILQGYYFENWMEDMDALYDAGEDIEVMGQDAIYNEIIEQDTLIKDILLRCAQYIS